MTDIERELDQYGTQTLDPLRRVPPIDPQFLAQEKAKFLLHGAELRKEFIPARAAQQSNIASHERPLQGTFSLSTLRALAVILLVLALVGGSSISVYAAQDSLPGEPLYKIKTASEDVRLALAFTPEGKLNLTLDYTTQRVHEIQSLVQSGKSLPDQASLRYQQELDAALQLAAQLNDQQILSALSDIKVQAIAQSQNIGQMIAHLPGQASSAMLRLQARLGEQVRLSNLGEENPQEFRREVSGRGQNRNGPKISPTSEQPGPNIEPATPLPPSKNEDGNGKNNPTNAPDQGNPGNNQEQNKGGNGNHGPNPTQKP
jgi:hypothetical protein